MKIGQPTDKPALTPTTTARTGSGEVATGKAAADGEASAKVVLSDAASALLSGTGAAKADFDAEKVERISKAIADGSYTVNHAAIADKLIANTQELLRKHAN